MSNRALNGAMLLVCLAVWVAVPGTVSAKVAEDGLVSYWRFDKGDVKEKRMKDLRGKNPGALIGDPEIVKGKIGDALALDGVDDYVDMGDVLDDVFSSNTYSIEVWVNMNNYQDSRGYYGQIIQKWHTSLGASDNAFALRADGRFGTNSKVTEFPAPSLGEWHFITVSMDEGNVDIYLDGVLVGW